jgi:predicted amidophosphoribosyltransferase
MEPVIQMQTEAAAPASAQPPGGQLECPSCKTLLDADTVMCYNCGETIAKNIVPDGKTAEAPSEKTPEPTVTCPGCQMLLPMGTALCYMCGQQIEEQPAKERQEPPTRVKRIRVI